MNMEKIKNLVLEGYYDQALVLLESMPLDQNTVYYLSILYRFKGLFDKEKDLITRSITHFPNWLYLKERYEWHRRPLFHMDPTFSRSFPRPLSYDERKPQSIPKNEILEHMCFVTGADSSYFSLLWEMIESLKATRYYKNIPINIIDCGLTDEEKNLLETHLSGVTIKDPGWVLPIEGIYKVDYKTFEKTYIKPSPKKFKAVVNKPFIHKIFEGYEYYFWINPNYWIQDDIILDDFVKLAESQNLGYSFHSAYEEQTTLRDHALNVDPNFYLSKDLIERLDQSRIFWDAIFCCKKDFLDIWATTTLNNYSEKKVFLYNLNEIVAGLILSNSRYTKVDRRCLTYNFIPFFNNNDNQTILYKENDDFLSLLNAYLSYENITINLQDIKNKGFTKIGLVRALDIKPYEGVAFDLGSNEKLQFLDIFNRSTRFRILDDINKQQVISMIGG